MTAIATVAAAATTTGGGSLSSFSSATAVKASAAAVMKAAMADAASAVAEHFHGSMLLISGLPPGTARCSPPFLTDLILNLPMQVLFTGCHAAANMPFILVLFKNDCDLFTEISVDLP